MYTLYILPFLIVFLPYLYGRKCPMNRPVYTQPAQPPKIVSGVVWPLLYILNAYSLYRVLKYGKGGQMKKLAVGLSIFATLLNMYYIHVAGCEKKWQLALWVLVAYTIITLTQMMATFAVDNVAGICIAPLVGWCIFASQLNLHLVNKNA